MDLVAFQRAFAALKARGWVASVRRGDTGVGHTLEQLLGLTENNVAVPDLGNVELKAHRVGSNSMITLFTFNRKVWKVPPLEAIKRYGTPDRDPAKAGRLGLYFTLSRTPNSTGLFLHVEETFIALRHISGEEIAVWQFEALATRFKQKVPALILVSAFGEKRGDREYFYYHRAQLMQDTSPSILYSQILAGNVLVDLRLHEKPTSARNHGTGFRVREDKLPLLFREVRDL
ncbi:MAG: MvaI/BcnI family restriction endonuclease [Anaerolineae bacterium]|nr:MvaI/BcnI family restriction endonuclease [Anaerolineae bacterium]